MKILFLDFDGVLNCGEYFDEMQKLMDSGRPVGDRLSDHWDIDPVRVGRLNRIVDATGARIVVSSSWRHGRTLEELRGILTARGFVGEVIGKTPDYVDCKDPLSKRMCGERGDEIKTWLDANPQVTSYVVIDDDNDMTAVRDRLVKTSFHGGGLLDEHVAKAIEILGGASHG